MSDRDAFLEALTQNEDDAVLRLVYADWLDEQGEHEEADRQRRWPAAKEWLAKICDDTVTYPELLEFGHQIAQDGAGAGFERTYFAGGAMCFTEPLWRKLDANRQAFFSNWSTVTGIPLPPSLQDKGFHFWECCPHDVSFWFGTPDETLPE